MSGIFSRSWELIKEMWGVLIKDKELLAFPILSGIAVILIIASFIIPLILTGLLGTAAGPLLLITFLCIFYFLAYFVVVFFNTGIIAYVHIRLSGSDPTIRERVYPQCDESPPRDSRMGPDLSNRGFDTQRYFTPGWCYGVTGFRDWRSGVERCYLLCDSSNDF